MSALLVIQAAADSTVACTTPVNAIPVSNAVVILGLLASAAVVAVAALRREGAP